MANIKTDLILKEETTTKVNTLKFINPRLNIKKKR